jgi:5,5'-dehydrodivanillate O-demethylase oxygenase subunit
MDRSLELLATTDTGIVKYRRLLKEQIELVGAGKDPINTYRDPAANRRLELPHPRDFYDRGIHGKASAYRRGSATGALGMQNSPINDLIEDLFEQAARGAPEFAQFPRAACKAFLQALPANDAISRGEAEV